MDSKPPERPGFNVVARFVFDRCFYSAQDLLKQPQFPTDDLRAFFRSIGIEPAHAEELLAGRVEQKESNNGE